MAGTTTRAAVSSPPFVVRKLSTKMLLCSCSISIKNQQKVTKRKNHLRPKILKTLSKPYPATTTPLLPQQPLENPIIPVVILPQTDDVLSPVEEEVFEPPSDQIEEVQEFQTSSSSPVEEFQVSSSSADIIGNISPRSLLKYGMWVVGLFVFQTICAVWMMGNANSKEKIENVDSLDSNKSLLDTNENIVIKNTSTTVLTVDELELNEKIEEIRAMAREARRIEKVEMDNSSEESNTLDHPSDRIDVQKGMATRLMKLEKEMESKFGEDIDSLDAKEEDTDLMFKKKFKFKSPAMNSLNEVRGFSGRDNGRTSKSKNRRDKVERRIDENSDSREGIWETVEVEIKKQGQVKSAKIRRDVGSAVSNTGSGSVHKTDQVQSSQPVMKSGQSRELRTMKKPSVNEITARSENRVVLGLNGSSKHELVETRTPNGKVTDKKSDSETHLWWLNLPYVLAIFMRSGSNSNVSEGLFTVTLNSQAYNVAFEDHSDANNFCCLLESFFEDLGGFNADIVPISAKDLLQEVKSNNMKMVVVKKRQIKLYAGQPLQDVERALLSLIQER